MPPISFVGQPLFLPRIPFALDAFQGPALKTHLFSEDGNLERYPEILSAFSRARYYSVPSYNRAPFATGKPGAAYLLIQGALRKPLHTETVVSEWGGFLSNGRRRLLSESDVDLSFYLGQAFTDYARFHAQLDQLAFAVFRKEALGNLEPFVDSLGKMAKTFRPYLKHPLEQDISFVETVVQALFEDVVSFPERVLPALLAGELSPKAFMSAYQEHHSLARSLDLIFNGEAFAGARVANVVHSYQQSPITIPHQAAFLGLIVYLLSLAKKHMPWACTQFFHLEIQNRISKPHYNFILWENTPTLKRLLGEDTQLARNLDQFMKTTWGAGARIKEMAPREHPTHLSLKVPQSDQVAPVHVDRNSINVQQLGVT